MEYEIVVGLEVHAELSTKSKIYCSCKNAFGAEVNTECCPVCTGLPGALPVLNEKVVESAVRMGYALGCTINPVSKQDRKNYFYPDLPKAYQISQFDIPLCEHGYVDVLVDGEEKRIGVTRIHIEEDAGKLLHGDSFSGTLVDFNRCGVPLIEIVSEPDMRSAAEAKAYMETLRDILLALDVSDCKMQEGSMRADVNVSVRPKDSTTFGTRVEMKNVNSFSAAAHAIEYESKRQIEVLENGGVIEQETRRWDDTQGKNFVMRSKEDAQDYRYFPEPDLGVIVLDEDYLASLKESIPELPNKRRVRYMNDYGLPEFDAGLLALDPERTAFFEAALAVGGAAPKALANWLIGDVARLLADKNQVLSQTSLTPEALVKLTALIEKGTISNTAGKAVLEELFANGGDPEAVVREKGLAQVSDTAALEAIVKDVLAQNEKSVVDYKKGKTNAAGYLVGQCMRASKGKANPQIVRELVQNALDEA
ncbi:Asp-tRNA(Asn)/Glu-tRNA(Gln) amidotransferase subunit GatB [Ethanoligenens harbinense]|uniref:Aspartyl/glutamyl-tRNA(Asn/Gln) amidotransferase subunit B n=1 Tax=Ethanoligenens harbinense (strain DSM 18485 / JCM 12961 / CGMCC 1.5033 / YUAN-3) TaxID=663278 RepID=E6U496_ETHHY|nr:Asp-tRNA(Asn)/Glu-tRNA(Gln) amidotransferase subunit GatB [Ethanoligenens harbinense]ADU26596.1 glutamyl-tRNA(Gln) amidotransferase, B subunit [Ethanoligenens harbinense YUAN-3]AVQ95721.1 Asp-tRNA(Asn)/Glu-tRNA(Gln) amidotransferase subunit GatB [Ethanoligenens harbinense YUAN-3]AYF38384.1 Asp-tRNA(Asn)/Glu-tRNA(Gln) amidotransferase subunit GatB [Ethanoligenens harbinense]AYF41129.1 Asp-tRNA(Asn)/Glu-tRNA(Gln) amidotransferase subunit GatB [Ethanoligenens harbinense]QCN91960.1 Asp-tRNA(Asn